MKRARILIVEDEPLVAEVICSVLETQYNVSAVTTVSEARACLRTSEFDLVIVDWRLPDGLGGEVVRLAHDLSVRSITMSGYLADDAADCGSSHLEKPFTLSQLTEVVHSSLRA